MSSLAGKTEEYLNQENYKLPTMVNAAVLEERVKYQKFLEERWVPAVERFMARYGDFDKVGQTDECLKLQEFYDYTDNRVRKATREHFETHFQQCSDCAKIIPQLREYQSQRRSSKTMAVLSRETLALYCRIKDYLSVKASAVR